MHRVDFPKLSESISNVTIINMTKLVLRLESWNANPYLIMLFHFSVTWLCPTMTKQGLRLGSWNRFMWMLSDFSSSLSSIKTTSINIIYITRWVNQWATELYILQNYFFYAKYVQIISNHFLLTQFGLVIPYGDRSGSALAQVMVCCLMASSHCLNQCWLIISKVQWC